MKITIYNAQTGFKKEWEEEDIWKNAKDIYEEIPDIPGCFLLLVKNQLGVKIQVITKDYYKFVLHYREEQKSIIINREEGEKVLKILMNDELEFVRLYDYPERYITVDKLQESHVIKEDKAEKELAHNPIYKIHKGKKYTEEEWKKFEQEQFELYAKKHNISVEEKTKKGGGFFLDEKESDW